MRYAIALALALFATAAWANCTTHTYFINGQYVVCTTCCYGNNCNTTCM